MAEPLATARELVAELQAGASNLKEEITVDTVLPVLSSLERTSAVLALMKAQSHAFDENVVPDVHLAKSTGTQRSKAANSATLAATLLHKELARLAQQGSPLGSPARRHVTSPTSSVGSAASGRKTAEAAAAAVSSDDSEDPLAPPRVPATPGNSPTFGAPAGGDVDVDTVAATPEPVPQTPLRKSADPAPVTAVTPQSRGAAPPAVPVAAVAAAAPASHTDKDEDEEGTPPLSAGADAPVVATSLLDSGAATAQAKPTAPVSPGDATAPAGLALADTHDADSTSSAASSREGESTDSVSAAGGVRGLALRVLHNTSSAVQGVVASVAEAQRAQDVSQYASEFLATAGARATAARDSLLELVAHVQRHPRRRRGG